ncbi:MAG: hypothetical protein ABF990_12240 [Acetobacter sp.]|uniref:hypothetical protein n=1 Tax=Acetobacter sp. TaxID=440 RepID=UPI0039E89009
MTGAVWLALALTQTACLLWAGALPWPRQKLGYAAPLPTHQRRVLRAGAGVLAGLALWPCLLWRSDSGWPLWIMLLSVCSVLTALGLSLLPYPPRKPPAPPGHRRL